MMKACVIGWPITHSRSPLIHNYWLKQHSIAGSYERRAIPPEGLTEFLTGLHKHGFIGCNVTLPHKEAAVAIIQHPDQSVKAIGALNTIYLRNGETHATSTDGHGFFLNLLAQFANFSLSQKNITILGAGGAAKALVEMLSHEHIKNLTIVNRTLDRAQQIQSTFAIPIKIEVPQNLPLILSETDLLINTTSQGMVGQPELEIDLSSLPSYSIVADLVYVPLKTKLLRDAEARGLRVLPGLGMLLHQATRGFELWFGAKPSVTPELYDLVARDIDPEYQP
jgi:shikimate dehydrogenase